MRNSILPTVMVALALGIVRAEAADGTNAMTEADKAKVRAQVESLKKEKLQAGERSSKATADAAKRQLQDVDQRHKESQEYINRKEKEWGWVVGPDAAKHAASAQSKALSERTEAEKAKIAGEGQKKAAAQQAAAKKNADNINQSVEGLKSQVSKDGKFGLQPEGSSLHVRNYGK
jgi:hypothetical protein